MSKLPKKYKDVLNNLPPIQRKMALILLQVNGAENAVEFIEGIMERTKTKQMIQLQLFR